MQSYRHCPLFTKDKKRKLSTNAKFRLSFRQRLRTLSSRDWDDLEIDLHVSLHDGFKIQLAGIVPVFLEFNV